nr:tetratricopeptide repeat protein [Pyrinomonadaceae bacterium]
MNNEQTITGNQNISVQDIKSGATVNITQILNNSFQYNDLLDKIKTKQELFDLLPEENTERRLAVSAELNELKDTLEEFKKNVIALAETFGKIEINTDRLRRAKEFFDQGDIGESRAVLETELEQMRDEQKYLLEQKDRYDNEILPNLINNSEEFYLLAMSTQTDYENPNRFETTCKYFEDSIKSYPTKDNVFNYALFLQEHTRFNEAEKLYYQYLNDFKYSISEYEYAGTLNNLANLHQAQNRYDEALREYEEALTIYRKLAETNPNTYLPFVALTLNNLAVLHSDQNRYDEALREYEEALTIY